MSRTTGLAVPSVLMMACRLFNMGVGLAMVPLLVHALGGKAFGAWAILLSCAAVWSELRLGLSTALVKHLSISLHAVDGEGVARTVSTVFACVSCVYVASLAAVLGWVKPLAAWLRLPGSGLLSAEGLLAVVLVSVALRSVLIMGTYSLVAARRFSAVAALVTLQPLVSNLGATLTALATRDLGWTLSAFWAGQLLVVGAGFAAARRQLGWRLRLDLVNPRTLRELLGYGLRSQLHEWAQTVSFQFDKFVIVRLLGLWPAALYEVGNRSMLALRSIPASGMEAFLPTAAIEANTGAPVGERLERMLTFSTYGILVFFAAPVAIAPVFLYAWLGEMGYVSRWTFVALAVGAAANLLASPLATLSQAAGRPELQARAAVVSMVANVPLSLGLVRVWGVEGAAAGTALAMALGAAVLFRQVTHAFGNDVRLVWRRSLVRLWPLFATCALWGAAVHWSFVRWFEGLSVSLRYGLGLRSLAGLAAVGLYLACLASLVAVQSAFLGLDSHERGLLAGLQQLFSARETDAP